MKKVIALLAVGILAGCSQTFSDAHPPAPDDYSRKAVNYRVAKSNDEKWTAYADAGWCVPSAGSTFDKYRRKGCTPLPPGGIRNVTGVAPSVASVGVLSGAAAANRQAGHDVVAARQRALFRASGYMPPGFPPFGGL